MHDFASSVLLSVLPSLLHLMNHRMMGKMQQIAKQRSFFLGRALQLDSTDEYYHFLPNYYRFHQSRLTSFSHEEIQPAKPIAPSPGDGTHDLDMHKGVIPTKGYGNGFHNNIMYCKAYRRIEIGRECK